MCRAKDIKNKVKIGQTCLVKWKDKKMYIAKILKRGSKLYDKIQNLIRINFIPYFLTFRKICHWKLFGKSNPQ